MSETPRKRARMSSGKECRACLVNIYDDSCCVDIFRAWETSFSGMGVSIAQDLAKLTSIQISVSDPYSKSICKKCCNRLKDAINFAWSVQNSDLALRKRYKDCTDENSLGPKPIQVDKNTSNALNKITAEVKEEVLTDDEHDMNENCSDQNDRKTDIKTEPEEITHSVVIEDKRLLIVVQPKKTSQTNGATEYLKKRPLDDVKEEPMSEDENEPDTDMPKDCKLSIKKFNTVRGLKVVNKNILKTEHASGNESQIINKIQEVLKLQKQKTYRNDSNVKSYTKTYSCNEKLEMYSNIYYCNKKLAKYSDVFTAKQEQELLELASRMDYVFYGLSRYEFLKLVYEYAVKNDVYPHTFRNKVGGMNWYTNFVKRHPDLRLKKPRPSSFSFNNSQVHRFFDVLEEQIKKHDIDATRLYNMGKIGIQISSNEPPRILTKVEKGQFETVNDKKKYTLQSVFCGCNAAGSFVPAYIIFNKNKDMHDNGSVSHNHEFLEWIKFFVEKVQPTSDKKVIVLLENHEPHKYFPAFEFASANNVIFVSFAPNATHRMQPLDCCVYEPLKKYFEQAVASFEMAHPSQTITQNNCVNWFFKAYLKAATAQNAVNGFNKTGLYPTDRYIFDEKPLNNPESNSQQTSQKEGLMKS